MCGFVPRDLLVVKRVVRRPGFLRDKRTEELLRFVRVVRAAPELDVARRGCAAIEKWHHMVELEEPAFAASTLGSNKCAPALIALPDLTFDRCRNVA